MTAPAYVARTQPTGIMMPNGFSSKLTLSAKPAIDLWEKSVKPSKVTGGEPIDISTMFNAAYLTARLRKLVKNEPLVTECGYDPDQLGGATGICAQVNVEQTLGHIFPNGMTVAYYGGVIDLDFAALKINELPMVTTTLAVTNYDPTANVEAGPTFVASGSGT